MCEYIIIMTMCIHYVTFQVTFQTANIRTYMCIIMHTSQVSKIGTIPQKKCDMLKNVTGSGKIQHSTSSIKTEILLRIFSI